MSNISITSEQLKTTNLIFLEHKKLSKEVPLLKSEINNLEYINQCWRHTDSIRSKNLDNCFRTIEDQNRSIKNLQKSLTKRRRVIQYGTAGSCVLLVLCLLLK